MEARTTLWALHTTVTSKEITALAQGKTMGLVLAEKFTGLQVLEMPDVHGAGVGLGEHAALDIVHVGHDWTLPWKRFYVELL